MVEAPVFIVGPARSGTTILYRTVVLHSSFFPSSIQLNETSVFPRSTSAYNITKETATPMFRYILEKEEPWQRFISAIQKVGRWQKLISPVTNRLPMSLSAWRLQGGRFVVQRFFEIAQEVRGTRIVEKTPHHLQHIDRIFDAFADSRVIATLRHPLDVFTSYRRRYQMEKNLANGDPSWFERTPEEFVRSYRNDLKLIGKAKEKYGKRVHVIKYEDFTSKPKRMFEEVCSFMDVDFEPDPLRGEHRSLAGYKPDPYLARPITSETKKWDDYISSEQARYIERSLVGTFEQFDYEMKTRPNSPN